MTTTTPPPDIDGVHTLSRALPGALRDGLRLTLWALRGFRYGATRGSWTNRTYNTILVLLGYPLTPLLAAIQALLLCRKTTRTYVYKPTTDALVALTVTATRTGWKITNVAAIPAGHGHGRAALPTMIDPLLRYADHHSIEISGAAANTRLRDYYLATIPGVEATGTLFNRWHQLRRPPRPQR